MHYQNLGKSDLKVSQISLGCMSLGTEHASNAKIIQQAYDQGINFFDTADLYHQGQNEESLGKALKPIRQKTIIATKVGNQIRKDGTGWDWNPSKAYILESVNHSLRRLQTDYIDLYQLHGGTIDDPIEESIEAFEQLKKEGKIRYYGISSIRPNVIREYIQKSNITSVMMQYSLLDRRPEETCLDLLQEAGISIISRGALAKGLLLDKKPIEYLDYTQEEVAKIQQRSQALGKPLAQAITFVLQQPAITSAVIGIRTMAQLKDVLNAAYDEIKEEALTQLRKVLKPKQYDEHR